MAATGFVPARHTQIYYETVGEGEPVVFVHAGIADCRMWDPQFENVPEGFQFVRLDLRGFGHTRLPNEPYTDCEDVLEVMDELNIGEAVIVGCSIGAAVTLHVATFAPYRLAGMVLIGADAPGFEPQSDYESPQWPDAVEAFKSGDLALVAELETEMWLVGLGRTREDVDPEVFELVRKMDMGALKTESRRDEVRKSFELGAMPHIEAPTLIVVGEHDLPQLIEAAEHLESVIPGSKRMIIRDAAHLPSLEQPAAFNRAFFDFLGS